MLPAKNACELEVPSQFVELRTVLVVLQLAVFVKYIERMELGDHIVESKSLLAEVGVGVVVFEVLEVGLGTVCLGEGQYIIN